MNALRITSVILLFLLTTTTFGQSEKLVFEDNFQRNESQETKDEPGNGWKTNSEKRAAGNKQVDLKDGAMHITCHPVADHGVSVVHEAPFRDGKIAIRLM